MHRTGEGIDEATYLPLSLAAEAAVLRRIAPTVTVKSLRREASRGRLPLYRFSGRDHTTLGDIRRMFKQCLAQPKVPASTSGDRTVGGSSGTPDSQTSELAALMESVKKLSGSCKRTSRASTGRTSGEVIPLRSQS